MVSSASVHWELHSLQTSALHSFLQVCLVSVQIVHGQKYHTLGHHAGVHNTHGHHHTGWPCQSQTFSCCCCSRLTPSTPGRHTGTGGMPLTLTSPAVPYADQYCCQVFAAHRVRGIQAKRNIKEYFLLGYYCRNPH